VVVVTYVFVGVVPGRPDSSVVVVTPGVVSFDARVVDVDVISVVVVEEKEEKIGMGKVIGVVLKGRAAMGNVEGIFSPGI
jgi:hypothetical protein